MSKLRINHNNQSPKLGMIGKIKVGMRHPEKGYPMSLDYFRLDSKPIYENAFKAMFGDKPSALPVFFASDDDANCSTYYELRDGKGGLFMYGDGETFYKAIDSTKGCKETFKTITNVDILASFESMEAFKQSYLDALQDIENKTSITKGKKPQILEWKPTLTLRFCIANFPILGYFELSTHGEKTSIDNVVNAYDSVFEQNGTVKGCGFFLQVDKHTTARATTEKHTYPVISLMPITPPKIDAQLFLK